MKTKIGFIGLALLGMLIISTSCKKEEDKVEETIGISFAVTTSDGVNWTTSSVTAKMEGNSFVIKAVKDNKEVVLTIKDFSKGTYRFDDTENHATYTPDNSNAANLYTSSESTDNYVEITNIHTDGVKFDGKFSFLAIDTNMNVVTVSGSWINVPKQ